MIFSSSSSFFAAFTAAQANFITNEIKLMCFIRKIHLKHTFCIFILSVYMIVKYILSMCLQYFFYIAFNRIIARMHIFKVQANMSMFACKISEWVVSTPLPSFFLAVANKFRRHLQMIQSYLLRSLSLSHTRAASGGDIVM